MLKIDVRIRRGERTLNFVAATNETAMGIVGASGTGKTTLLHVLAGLLQPEEGRIEILGETVFDSKKGINVPAHRRRVGCVFQDARLFPHLSVENNIRFGERICPASDRRFGFDETVDLLGLRQLLPKRPRELSGGEIQRAALARTLMASPRLILLDEPLSALDQNLRRHLLPYFGAVMTELAIPMLYVSHNLSELLQLTDHLMVIHDDRVAGIGRFMDLVQNRVLLDAPFASDLCNVWTMQLKKNRPETGSSLLETTGHGGVFLNGPLASFEQGTKVRVLFSADDVALALKPVEGVSIRNQFPAVLRRHVKRGGTIYCELDAGDGASLLVEVSTGAFAELNLDTENEKRVYCLLKVGAIRVRALRSGHRS